MSKNTGYDRKRTQSSDLEDRTLGVGNPDAKSRDAGKHASRWAKVNLTGGGSTPGTVVEYDVPHDLGEIPTMCVLESVENATTPLTFIKATEARKSNWSHSHCHMALRLEAGSFDGCVGNFRVFGR